ncbi:endonuclease SmrB [Echinimonas agarilytica]|uniref:Ribosome rescue factor SmrB n=2 Tax=Echinimonas agarilytica TaxID=1215918 RepID=A0AA41W5C6_9GAMM|nr:endonuclease SmrB [Echinimonas agarilytica]
MSDQPEDQELEFRQLMADVKQLRQDTITPPVQRKKIRSDKIVAQQKTAQREADFFFSDTFEAHFDDDETVRWLSQSAPADAVKKLKRGQLEPELLLDLHGMTQAQAKIELAALLVEAQRQNIDCITVMTGLGTGVLRKRLPHWLVQHPAVLAFTQATKAWGGRSALLIMLETSDPIF